jgi:hypothetical protein
MKRCKYSPEMPPDLIKDLFESRTTSELDWPQGKPLPDLNQFVDRRIVNEVLKEMGRTPGGSDGRLDSCIAHGRVAL